MRRQELGRGSQLGGDFLLEDCTRNLVEHAHQTELPFGGAAMNMVSTPPDAMAKDARVSVSVAAPMLSLATSCKGNAGPGLPTTACKGAA